MTSEEQGYNDMMSDACAQGADSMQEAIEEHIEKLCEKVLDAVIRVECTGSCYEVIEECDFREIFNEYVK